MLAKRVYRNHILIVYNLYRNIKLPILFKQVSLRMKTLKNLFKRQMVSAAGAVQACEKRRCYKKNLFAAG